MTQNEYFGIAEALFARCIELSRRKNQDYSSPDDRPADELAPFANLMACERAFDISAEQGIIVRLTDKLSRLRNLSREGHKRAVEDECMEDTLMDIINYCALWYGLLCARSRKNV